ncbi:hypothetical protein PR202_ga20305 [Eleusine coracana subsp. coracana]|uniref:Probable ATP-dependent RNA helicase spindle-E n=1 Tax=Eleusine coracana subsp. coracana TaxID=191504 RepID=A0AAV5CXU9_ELECO|nr:hypothetical protein PR202_ga20305 [Eleusine coracana subsp. coracana]
MAPKKKQPAPKQKPKTASASSSSSAAAAPRLQISSENERRLRRLLLNSSATAVPAPAPSDGPAARSESREQKTRRLRGVYDKLALEGFSSSQIEQALSALFDSATFESALDWLCFNLPGDELPLKFSSGTNATSRADAEGSIKVLSTAKDNWVPQSRETEEEKMSTDRLETKIVSRREEDVSLDDGRASQAAWIRQYMERQEEDDDTNSNDSLTWEDHCTPSFEVVEAKPSRRKSKAAKKNSKHGNSKEEISQSAHSSSNPESENVEAGHNDSGATENKSDNLVNIDDGSGLQKAVPKDVTETCTKETEEEEVELDNLFFEDSSAWDAVAPEILKQQKLEKLAHDGYGHLLGNIDDIWKKGDSGKMPKAILQKFCQKLGWEAPKYSKLSEKNGKFVYAVNVLRGATGRGKSRKAGGLTKIQLPELDEEYGSVEEAQSRVAAFALYQFFADLPLHQLLTEPYSSLVLRWKEGELSSTSRVLDTEDSRRANFVDMLLNMDTDTISTSQIEDGSAGGTFYDSGNTEDKKPVYEQRDDTMLNRTVNLDKYVFFLCALIATVSPFFPLSIRDGQKNHFLQLLKENDVIVVSGETGCGKTTQVPQFILDDMIESELGGYCNIVCTQPRRIAAISVAERVSDERCESSPGSKDSLVGYQVRLDSARNERTKLLFCTTGILLRKLTGNTDLSDVTHVVVDEVHERTILGDFLLIVLKNLVEKRSNLQGRKLKVILMSATVDSSLFARYFGGCPVISVEGRTHPVSTHFLEDVYEQLDYCLALDSPASGAYFAQHGEKKRLNEDVIDFDLLEDLICYIDENCPPGAVLVFLPGVAEIDMLIDRLSASVRFGGPSSDWILPLHSLLGPVDQRKVFESPPDNFRKVIIATDIAETSITIDDKMSSIIEDWISRANAKQRRGRAGRVKPGLCFCLYTRHRFENIMRPFQAVEPPNEEAISTAVNLLYKVGAFEGHEELSSLGYHLAKLPVDVLIGKMMLYGAIFGCLSPILSVAAFLSYKSPFLSPKDEKVNVEKAKAALSNQNLDGSTSATDNKQSDHLLMIIAYDKWSRILQEHGAKSARQFCHSFYLNSTVMYMIRDMRLQFGTLLADIGLIDLPKDSLGLKEGRRKNNLETWFSNMSVPFNMYARRTSVIKVYTLMLQQRWRVLILEVLEEESPLMFYLAGTVLDELGFPLSPPLPPTSHPAAAGHLDAAAAAVRHGRPLATSSLPHMRLLLPPPAPPLPPPEPLPPPAPPPQPLLWPSRARVRARPSPTLLSARRARSPPPPLHLQLRPPVP